MPFGWLSGLEIRVPGAGIQGHMPWALRRIGGGVHPAYSGKAMLVRYSDPSDPRSDPTPAAMRSTPHRFGENPHADVL